METIKLRLYALGFQVIRAFWNLCLKNYDKRGTFYKACLENGYHRKYITDEINSLTRDICRCRQ